MMPARPLSGGHNIWTATYFQILVVINSVPKPTLFFNILAHISLWNEMQKMQKKNMGPGQIWGTFTW